MVGLYQKKCGDDFLKMILYHCLEVKNNYMNNSNFSVIKYEKYDGKC